MGVGLLCRRHDLFLGGIRLAHGDILPDGPGLQPGILKHHAYAVPQVIPAHIPGIHPIQQNFAAVGVIEPHEQVDKSGFAAAGGADDGDALARLDAEVEVLDEGLLRGIGEFQISDLYASPNFFRLPGILRLRGTLRGLDQLEHPSGTGQSVLQLGDHAGNLIEGLGILVGVVQEAGQVAHGNAAADGDESTGQAHPRVHHGIDEPGAGIYQRGEENRPQGSLLQPSVDLVELLHGGVFMPEGADHLDVADGLINQAGLLAPGHGLEPEHGIGPGGDEIGNQQGQRRDAHHHQGDAPMDAKHEQKGTQNGHNARKQLGKSHKQAVGKGVHVRNDPADNVALGVLIQIAQGQHLNMAECLVADIPGDPVGHAVIQLVHHELGQRGNAGADHHTPQRHCHGGKVYPARVHDAVDGAAHQNGDV